MTVIHLDEDNFEEEVRESAIPVVVDFWAPWCGPCQMMGPIFESVSADFAGKVKFAKLNVDELPEHASSFGVQGIPTLVVLKKNKEVGRIVGLLAKDALKQKIQSFL